MLTLGIDIGSTACKCVVLQDGKEIIGKAVVGLGTGTVGAQNAFEEALKDAGVTREQISSVYATGYGRFTFPMADNQKSEICCHAKGIHSLLPDVRTIIDIGGQDIKALKINEKGMLINFVMNDKCAAGTGRFLDVMARVLNVRTEELGALDANAEGEVSISNTCTVFAESEVISKLSSNVRLEDLVRGIHTSVAKRVASLAFRNGIIEKVTMSGGVALNEGVVRALGRELKTDIIVHEDCQLAGALGAALFAYEESSKEK
ncbi:acyl-CoA dehydratase activase [Clostridia bacterium OttesenSCG-928-F22]|nr:acyl-CoA dehydratase activase [Clostridia bacterium OttesenSCG-928-F22]